VSLPNNTEVIKRRDDGNSKLETGNLKRVTRYEEQNKKGEKEEKKIRRDNRIYISGYSSFKHRRGPGIGFLTFIRVVPDPP